MKTFPTLYKKTSTGAIQQWNIMVREPYPSNAVIETTHGQVGTDKPQTTFDNIKEGKNPGKANATTALEQACKEAESKWLKQKKKGYVESYDDAVAGKIDKIIKGGVNPMLAHKFADHGHKIKFPCFGQPKLDGIRCIAVIDGGVCTLWTRTRKQIHSLPHIVADLETNYFGEYMVLDGELYNHEFKDRFDKIVSAVRKDEPSELSAQVQYHIYDTVEDHVTFEMRNYWLKNHVTQTNSIILVDTFDVQKADVSYQMSLHIGAGYEGLMLRNSDSLYKGKRSYDLQKVKTFDDGEFLIIGINEGRGVLAGKVGSFICKTDDGTEFQAKMKGDHDMLKAYFENHSLWQGKMLTVQYQGMTSTNDVPRFPVGITLRDYE